MATDLVPNRGTRSTRSVHDTCYRATSVAVASPRARRSAWPTSSDSASRSTSACSSASTRSSPTRPTSTAPRRSATSSGRPRRGAVGRRRREAVGTVTLVYDHHSTRPRRQAHRAPAHPPRGDRLDAARASRRAPLSRGRRAARRGARDQAHRRRPHRHQGRQARQVRRHDDRRRSSEARRRGVVRRHRPLRPSTGSTGWRAPDSPIHRVDPRAKVLATAVFVVCVVSFGKYDVLGLLPFASSPSSSPPRAASRSGFSARLLLIVSPFALVVGVFNPLLDRDGRRAGGRRRRSPAAGSRTPRSCCASCSRRRRRSC